MMKAALSTCRACDYRNDEGSLQCGMCGALLRREAPPTRTLAAGPAGYPPAEPPAVPAPLRPGAARRAALAGREPWFFLLFGALGAPVFGLLPVLRFAGWFFRSLCHEIGHTAVAWSLGMPAFPAIRIDGHAASIHKPQIVPLAILLWIGLGVLAWRRRRSRPVLAALGAVTVAYPVLAFTRAGDLLHLLGGHLGELAFATVFLWRALSGGFTQSARERLSYAVVGCYLSGSNVILCGGLVLSPAAREHYVDNVSFGIANDYVRAAGDVLGWSLPGVALWMLPVSLLPLPLAILAWRKTGDA